MNETKRDISIPMGEATGKSLLIAVPIAHHSGCVILFDSRVSCGPCQRKYDLLWISSAVRNLHPRIHSHVRLGILCKKILAGFQTWLSIENPHAVRALQRTHGHSPLSHRLFRAWAFARHPAVDHQPVHRRYSAFLLWHSLHNCRGRRLSHPVDHPQCKTEHPR